MTNKKVKSNQELFLRCDSCGDELGNNFRMLEKSELYLELKRWRLTTAKEESQPAFIIFYNRTLRELVLHHPLSMAQLEQIHGVGAVKLERWGYDLLEILQKNEPMNLGHLKRSCDSCEGRSNVEFPALERMIEKFRKGRDVLEPPLDPNDPTMGVPVRRSRCKTCGQPWDGIRNPAKRTGTIPEWWDGGRFFPWSEKADMVNPRTHITFKRNTADDGSDRIVVTIQANTVGDLGNAFEDYVTDPKVGGISNTAKPPGPFIFLPEWVSRPLNYIGSNSQGYWEITFQHPYRGA